MRDPERTDAFLERLKKIWMRNPDLRFGQLVLNISRNSSLLYNIEDDEFIEKMEKYYTPKKCPTLSTLSDKEFEKVASNICNLMNDEELIELIEKYSSPMRLAFLEEKFKSYANNGGVLTPWCEAMVERIQNRLGEFEECKERDV